MRYADVTREMLAAMMLGQLHIWDAFPRRLSRRYSLRSLCTHAVADARYQQYF